MSVLVFSRFPGT